MSLPSQINRFKIESEVGRGGMGVVYRAVDPVLKRPVALKLLAPHLGSDPDALSRFHREAESVAGLKHAHIAIVYEFGEVDSRPYIAMEWIEGRDLKAVMDSDGQFSLERSFSLFRQLASALDYAHRQGVIHRDLKPANIIVGPDDQAVIVDFGLAWLDTAPSITLSGSILGTPRYMSPEQIEGGRVDNRSDLYSLALILYEMLAGRPAFNAPTPPALMHQQLFVPPPPITEINPAISPNVETALMKALSKNPDDRFQSAQEFALALQASLPTLALSEAETHSSRWSFKPYRWWAAGAIAVLLVVVLAMLVPAYFFQPDELVAQPTAIPPTAIPPTLAPAPTPASDDVVPTPPQATPLPDIDAPRVWGMTSGDWRHWHFVEVPFAPLDPEARWTYQPESSGHSELLAADGLIILNTGDGIVQALDWNSGEVVWETRLGVEMTLPPGIYADDEFAVVILPTADGALYALGLSDARLMWRIDPESLGGVIQSINISSDDNIIALTNTGQLHVIHSPSGEIYGTLSLGEDYASAYPATLNDTAVFFSADSHIVYALEIVTEAIAWESGLSGYPTTPPLGDGGWGYVVVGTEEGWVHAFSSLTGKTVWEFQLDGPIIGLAADWEQIYALTGNGVLYAWDAWDKKLLWKVELDVPVTAGPVVNDEYILLATEDSEILTLSAENGEIQHNRTLSTDDPVFSLMPTGNWLFARSDESIYAFASDE